VLRSDEERADGPHLVCSSCCPFMAWVARLVATGCALALADRAYTIDAINRCVRERIAARCMAESALPVGTVADRHHHSGDGPCLPSEQVRGDVVSGRPSLVLTFSTGSPQALAGADGLGVSGVLLRYLRAPH